MDCAEAKLQIEPYVAGEIPADLKGALEDHLAGCAECRLDSELTRASRSDPVGPDPNAAPALFLESIRPDEAPAQPADSTPGQGAAPGPNGATRAADGSWTLESIFGAGGERGAAGGDALAERPGDAPAERGGDALAERAAAAAEPLPEHDLPAMLRGPGPPSPADEPPDSDAPTWDFEPADLKGTAKPPEGSLFFAEEALSRGTAAKKKSGVPRILLWGAGGLLGVGLLALSIWIAMTVRQPLPSAGVTEHPPIRAGNGPGIPSADGGASPSSAPEAAPSGAAAGSAPIQTTAPAGEASSAPSTGAEIPIETGTTRPLDAAPSTTESAPSISPPPVPKTTPTRATIAATTKPVGTKPAATKPVATKPAATKPAGTKPAPARPAPAGPAEQPDDDIAALRPPVSGSEPARSSPPKTTTSVAPATTSPAPSTGASGTAPTAAEPPAAPPPAAPGVTVERPIDRLHLATLNAEQNADLLALRKLRDAWRGLVKGSLGPDRARAKRELADCLWAIQTLTAKHSDQKEALVAYRDFVLNAPAGGADARTVARMRQLEDAVSESR